MVVARHHVADTHRAAARAAARRAIVVVAVRRGEEYALLNAWRSFPHAAATRRSVVAQCHAHVHHHARAAARELCVVENDSKSRVTATHKLYFPRFAISLLEPRPKFVVFRVLSIYSEMRMKVSASYPVSCAHISC